MEDQCDSNPITNTSDDPQRYNSSQDDTDISSITDATDSSDVTSLFASAFNLMGYHPEAKDAVAASLVVLS